ncbi:hypothetical protein KFL_010640060 [Klebsormidium nitens]|uniref:Uncharacterized protein n=1 Tax=Klebsormidium nitens TaxID=105231 RepID=A0A1Y1IPK9_KLENI|nr:hypothetical protein KFL_010640060 [Klebsormidium nitens]|eukprot:GAQ92593.1 hypothetical protein KFL_010640060 [Klebsormidium nitens]
MTSLPDTTISVGKLQQWDLPDGLAEKVLVGAGWSTPKNFGKIITYTFLDAAKQKPIGVEYGVDQYGGYNAMRFLDLSGW